MVWDLIIAAFATAIGFVGSGIIASFYQLITAQPPKFDIEDSSILAGVAGVLLLMFAGPVILMRNAIRGRLLERRPVGWLAASTCIAGAWSLCSGVVLLQFGLALRNTLIL